ncbi:MAG: transglycosylase SLT domain-containing protein [Deltaproteobacteria bacterium]|nr:MAG: transglycosylase SLT domain-containing protein [Deltaproteobacteria bacterium]
MLFKSTQRDAQKMIKKVFQNVVLVGLCFGFAAGCAKSNNTGSSRSDRGFSQSGMPQSSSDSHKPSIPLVMNDRVQDWIDYFQGRGRPHFERYLRRSGKYIPMMKKILHQEGLPEDLIYLAMIESGFNSQAYSKAKATGTWQFISQTGRRYGLDADQWFDERRDPEKSTVAASKYLKDLYARYNDWYLAAAGYNAGEGKIDRAIRKYNTEDFWELTQGRYLKPETKDYVPKLIAAAMIAKNPKKYGFTDIEYEEPVETAEVTLNKPIDLRVAAKCAEVSYEDMRSLNPELIRWVTPVSRQEYKLKVPASAKDKFEQNYAALQPDNHLGEDKLRVTKAQTLDRVAKKQGVPTVLLAAANNMGTREMVKPGTELIIPFTPPEGERFTDASERGSKKCHKKRGCTEDRVVASRGRKLVRVSKSREVGTLSGETRRSKKLAMIEKAESKKTHNLHRVRDGESINSIAKKYKVSPNQIKDLNRISNGKKLKKGQSLKIPSKQTASLN